MFTFTRLNFADTENQKTKMRGKFYTKHFLAEINLRQERFFVSNLIISGINTNIILQIAFQ